MQLTYFFNKSDRRYIDKNLLQVPNQQNHPNPVNVIMLEDTSIARPVFKMHDAVVYMTANYCYINELMRYYFIDDIELSNGYAYLHCTCDVLSSYKDALRDQNVIIKRQEFEFDLMQNDGEMPVKQYPAKRCIAQFESPFAMTRNEFVIGVVGSVDSSE